MVADAERHRDEDARLRELIDARNELDAAAYQVERRLDELGDAVPGAREGPGRDAGRATPGRRSRSEAPLDRLRSLTGELQQVYQGLARPASGPAAGGGRRPARRRRPDGAGDDDDVIDAEFTAELSRDDRRGPATHRTGRRTARAGRRRPSAEPSASTGGAGSPSWRTSGGARWPTWTTSASGAPRASTRPAADERARVAATWLPVLDNLDLALEHAGADPDADHRRASGRSATRRSACWRGSASRAATTSARRSTRPGTRRSASCRRPTLAPGTVVAGRAARLRRRRPAAAARPRSWWPRAGLMAAGPRLLRGPRRRRGRRARTRSSGPTASWPARTTPTSTRTRLPRSGSRRSPRPTTCCPIRSTRRRYDAFGAGLPPGARGRRPGRLAPAPATPAPARRRAAPAGGRRRGERSGAGGVRRRRRPRGPARRASSAAAAGGGWGPIPGADQEAEIELTRRGGLPRRPPPVTLAGPDGTAHARRDHPGRGRPTGSGSGWPARAAGAAAAPPPATCTWSSGSRRTRATGSRAATCTSTLPLAPWEAALGARSPSTRPAARPR